MRELVIVFGICTIICFCTTLVCMSLDAIAKAIKERDKS